MNIGYARKLIEKSSIQSQIMILESAGCEKIYIDHTFEINEDRPGLIKMLKNIKKGDTVVVHKANCIFASLQHMEDLISKFNELGVCFKSLNEPLFDTGSNSKLLLDTLDIIIQFKKSVHFKRTKKVLMMPPKKHYIR